MSAIAIARIRTTEPAPARTGTTVRAEIVEGLRFVVGHRLLRPIVLCTASSNLAGGIGLAVLVLFLVDDLGLPEVGVGAAVAAVGVGGLAGALTAGAWTRRLGQARTIVVSLLVTTPLVLLIPLGGPGPLILLTAVGLFADGYGGVVYNVAQVSFRQAICPDRLLGRMNAGVRFLVWGTIPVGGLIGGGLGELLGPRGALLVACCAQLLSLLPLLLSPLRRLRDLPGQ